MAFTAPVTRATDFLVTAAVWNAEHVDNMNTAWPHLTVRKTSDETDSTGTLQNDDSLLLVMATNEIWQFRFNLLVVAAGTTDFASRLTFPSGSISVIYYSAGGAAFTGSDVSSASSPTGSVILPTTGTVSNFVICEGVMSNGGSAGNLQLQWTGNAAATCTVKANSTLWAVKLA